MPSCGAADLLWQANFAFWSDHLDYHRENVISRILEAFPNQRPGAFDINFNQYPAALGPNYIIAQPDGIDFYFVQPMFRRKVCRQ